MNNPHKNARTTIYSREQIVLRHNQGWTAQEIAEAFAISVRTVYKWLKRHRDQGISGLSNRSSAPHNNPGAYVAGWYNLIAKLRSFRMTALEIAQSLSFPRSTIAYHLKALGLSRLNRLTPPEPVRRYERKRPGDLIHLDIKKLRRFNRLGHRFARAIVAPGRPALAMNASTSPSMITQGSPMSRYCLMKKARPVPTSSPGQPGGLQDRG